MFACIILFIVTGDTERIKRHSQMVIFLFLVFWPDMHLMACYCAGNFTFIIQRQVAMVHSRIFADSVTETGTMAFQADLGRSILQFPFGGTENKPAPQCLRRICMTDRTITIVIMRTRSEFCAGGLIAGNAGSTQDQQTCKHCANKFQTVHFKSETSQ